MPRFYCPVPLTCGATLVLPPAAARHVQVLRLQPGDALTVFNGLPNPTMGTTTVEFAATVVRMGRSDVEVLIGVAHMISREAPRQVHLAVGMPANERMDWLVEKATELGVASIQPLVTERTVLRLTGERAIKKQQHWQSIAVAACEQCGRNTVPPVHAPLVFNRWLEAFDAAPTHHRLMLSLAQPTAGLSTVVTTVPTLSITVLSGPEGGLSPQEGSRAIQAAFTPVSLGQRVLRAETAALAALVALTLA